MRAMLMSASFRSYWAHLRPRSWPVVFGHYGCGAVIALAHWRGESIAVVLARALTGGLLWTICLNGGTLALNSAFDKDEGDIGYLDAPPPVPRGLAAVAAGLMATGGALSLALTPGYAAVYGACFILSLLYSMPPARLKAVAGADLLVNMAGYGALTFAAGALAAGPPPSGSEAPGFRCGIWALAASFAFLFGAFYPMTQIYQIPEDMERGDRTLAVRLGARGSLWLSFGMLGCSLASQMVAGHGALLGAPRWGMACIVLVYAAWAFFTADWLRRIDDYPAKKGMYRALKLWGVTSLVTVAAFSFGEHGKPHEGHERAWMVLFRSASTPSGVFHDGNWFIQHLTCRFSAP